MPKQNHSPSIDILITETNALYAHLLTASAPENNDGSIPLNIQADLMSDFVNRASRVKELVNQFHENQTSISDFETFLLRSYRELNSQQKEAVSLLIAFMVTGVKS